MGWGISIPALGINTGEFIGGDVGNVLSNVSREANTPLGRAAIGYMIGGPWAAAALGGAKAIENQQKSMRDVQKQNTDFGPLTSRWGNFQEDVATTMPQQAIQDLKSQSQVGVSSGLQSLGQKGGQGVGAANRLQSQSKWDVAQGAAGINQGAQEMGTQFAMNKITGVDIPVIQGQQLAEAQKQASLDQARANTNATYGMLAGAALGGFGVPGMFAGSATGAMLGSQLGGAAGRSKTISSAWGG